MVQFEKGCLWQRSRCESLKISGVRGVEVKLFRAGDGERLSIRSSPTRRFRLFGIGGFSRWGVRCWKAGFSVGKALGVLSTSPGCKVSSKEVNEGKTVLFKVFGGR